MADRRLLLEEVADMVRDRGRRMRSVLRNVNDINWAMKIATINWRVQRRVNLRSGAAVSVIFNMLAVHIIHGGQKQRQSTLGVVSSLHKLLELRWMVGSIQGRELWILRIRWSHRLGRRIVSRHARWDRVHAGQSSKILGAHASDGSERRNGSRSTVLRDTCTGIGTSCLQLLLLFLLLSSHGAVLFCPFFVRKRDRKT